MAKMVGFLCPLKAEWLNKVINLSIEGMKAENIKEALNDYISFELKSPDNIRKSREILMNLWIYPFDDEKANLIRQQALEEIKNGNEDKLAMHWCMLLLSYPVFSDVAGMIGKLTMMQDSFSVAWLKGKMTEQWGERSTLLRSVEKVLQTMRQIGIAESKGGVYTVRRYEIKNDATKKIILKTILALKMQAYYEPSELAKVPQMFPFEYTVDSELIFGNQDFEMGNFGGSPVVVG